MKLFLLLANAWLFGLLALLHFYWMLGGKWALTNALPQGAADQRPIFVPGRLMTLAVAGVLLLGMFLNVLPLVDQDALLSEPVGRNGLLVIGLLFGVRTLGDFRYVGLTKRIRDTPFAHYDTRLYTPLCAAFAWSHFVCFALLR